MGTPVAYGAAANVAILAGTSAIVLTDSVLSNDLSIGPGVTLARSLVSVIGQTPDSNVNHLTIQVSLDMLRGLANPDDEDFYLHGVALTDQAVLMAPSFWLGIAGANDVEENPEITLPPVRTGNIIEYNVSVIVSLSP